jgi:hypothetical protein
MDPTASLGILAKKKKTFNTAGTEPRFSGRPARNLVSMSTEIPGSHNPFDLFGLFSYLLRHVIEGCMYVCVGLCSSDSEVSGQLSS